MEVLKTLYPGSYLSYNSGSISTIKRDRNGSFKVKIHLNKKLIKRGLKS